MASSIILAINKLLKYWEPLDVATDISHVRNRQRREARVLQILEGIGFSWRIYFVAFFGFLASSWSLIAINITMPALTFVYNFHDKQDLILDCATLSGTVLGMILFGHLADRVGRSALYGFELLIVLSAVGGAAFTSQGYAATGPDGLHSMDMEAALIWWRVALGLGIGAEYPMSAVIAAEFTSTAWRGTMLAAIFIAQPVGRLLAYSLNIGILSGFANSYQQDMWATHEEMLSSDPSLAMPKLTVDKVWRLVIGLAGVPAVFAVALRIFIPETPRFYSAVKRDMRKAYEAAIRLGSASPRPEDAESCGSDDLDELDNTQEPQTSWGAAANAYFFGKSQGWKPLFAITLQWLLLDVCFYGTGLDSPSTLAALWLDKAPGEQRAEWNVDPGNPGAGIYDVLYWNSKRTLLTTSTSAIAGSICVIPLVGFVSRKTLFIVTSALLAVTFAATAISIHFTYAQAPSHVASIVFYAITQFLFNIGPNTLTFIIAVEIFPTEFRGTSYGIAAAGGKVGAIIIRPIVQTMGPKDGFRLPVLLGVFAVIMALMAVLAWIEPYGVGWPEIQRVDPGQNWFRRLNNLSLEEISPWPPILEDDEGEGQPQAPVEALKIHHAEELADEPKRSTDEHADGAAAPNNHHRHTPIAASYLRPHANGTPATSHFNDSGYVMEEIRHS
ncbi:major facilitator superfamily domain-containing protein [Microdochium trichocladiopsis]|uniref:Major facilitator superfamily domain-containing protein n=1 Tax=Microdochium trichocladiopsis TaxID=1682393 RepID=A0A9P9BP20_9PEZI|nr:major facilitator superfamily domain-containing protein [Microdochium trichocladiopsis]KAH7028824.1 major facilitator superfamily domain-containing protein [Microdochium trichocladiopsis]